MDVNLPFELYSIGVPSHDEKLTQLMGSDAVQRQGFKGKLLSQLKQLPLLLKLPWRLLIGVKATLAFLANYLNTYFFPTLWHTPKASLYYLHAPYQFPAVYLLCKRYQARFVYDAHDFYIDSSRLWLYRYIEKLCVKNAAEVVTVSDGIARLLEHAFERRPIVVRNCHDGRLDQVPPQHMRQILNLPPEAFLLVAVCSPKYGRAVQEAIDAMVVLPQLVHLVFVGKGYTLYLDSVCGTVLEGRVHFLPPIKPYEVVPFIRGAEAAIVLHYAVTSNHLNALPNGFFQYIAAELPLLYPEELPEIKQLAEFYGLGVPIDPHSPQSIAQAVLELADDAERLSMYKRNVQRAKRDINWEREEVVLRDLLAHLLDSEH
ncbi:MAG: hypothetical protein JW850_02150 [Thermoflexales bacterium]|nr:hypothetical protein [Thermoflexales bacterium]